MFYFTFNYDLSWLAIDFPFSINAQPVHLFTIKNLKF